MKDSAERVGRYQLLGPIGAGPCGAVSRAKVYGVAGFERQFAVKRFHPELTITSPLAQALSSAARAYGSLEHPRIARMSEFGVAQGQTFTAVELVAGLDAARLVAEARLAGITLAAGGALALISQAARAVGYAHGRGLTHLGLSPTNMIVTADGDVKITDFGILAAGLPQRPVDTARLQNRIQYLSPEQLAGEATSAATDVFQLGVIAYELVTGERTFRGATAQHIAQAILAGPPPEPALPRPIVRVLARCLARSPFERFPDARALADALDAALRVAPVPGTRKDVGMQVQATMDRLAKLNEGELSGMVALHIGTGPVAMHDAADISNEASTVAVQASVEIATQEFVRPDTPVPGPTPLVGPALPKPLIPAPPAAGPPTPSGKLPAVATLMGIPAIRGGVPPIKPPPAIPTIGKPAPAPPPAIARTKSAPEVVPPTTIPAVARTKSAPEVVAPPPSPPARRTAPAAAPPPPLDAPRKTAMTPVPRAPSEPPVVARTKSNPNVEALPRPLLPNPITDQPSGGLDVEALFEGVLTNPAAEAMAPDPLDGGNTVLGSQTVLGVAPSSLPSAPPKLPRTKPASVPDHYDVPTGEMPSMQREQLLAQAARGQSITEVDQEIDLNERSVALSSSQEIEVPLIPAAASTLPGTPPPPVRVSTPSAAPPSTPATPGAGMLAAKKKTSRAPLIAGIVLIAGGGLAVAGWQLYERVLDKPDEPSNVVTTPTKAKHDAGTKPVAVDAAQVAAVTIDAGSATPSATIDAAAAAPVLDAPVVAAVADAAVPAAPPDASEKTTPAPTPTPGSKDQLSITSTPAGARVYIDGADSGVTPLKLPASPDKHTVALLLPGHELYIAQVDGAGKFQIPLTEITPAAGPAGVKVIKCKDKDRYYVFVDAKPTGMLCPTERINVELGEHVVEIYDAVTETRRKWDVVVKDTRLSYRVKVE